VLKTLSDLFGISGCEESVKNVIQNNIAPFCDEIKTDALGNLICIKKGTTNKKILFNAFMDEAGLIVSEITSKGYIKFKTVGFKDVRGLIGKRFLINNSVTGFIGAIPPHLKKDSKDEKIKSDDLFIDIGTSSKEETEKLVDLGDYISYYPTFVELGDTYIKGKALSSRATCFILTELIKNIKNTPYNLYFVFSVQNKVMYRGIKTAASYINPDYCISVGISEENDIIKCGKGPVIKLMDASVISDKKITESLKKCSSKIAVQFEVNDKSRSAAGIVSLVGDGIVSGEISIPVKNPDTQAEIINKKDITDTIAVLNNLISSEEL